MEVHVRLLLINYRRCQLTASFPDTAKFLHGQFRSLSQHFHFSINWYVLLRQMRNAGTDSDPTVYSATSCQYE